MLSRISNLFRACAAFGADRLSPRLICDDVCEWSTFQPGMECLALFAPMTIQRRPPRTIEPKLYEEYVNRLSANLRGRYLVKLPNAQVIGENGLVRLHDGAFATESIYNRGLLETDPYFRSPPRRAQQLAGNYFSLLVNWSKTGNYYHWLHDTLLRLYGALEHLPADIKYLVPKDLKSFQVDSLALLGIEPSCCIELEPNNAVQLEHLYFAPPTTNSGSDRTSADLWLKERFLKALNISNPVPHRRIYVTRRAAPSRRVVNEAQVEDLVAQYGFETVACETLTMKEQIKVFSAAEIVIGSHGAGLTNIWFAPSGTRVVDILQPSYSTLVYVFWCLGDALGHEYWYFWGESPNLAAPSGTGTDMSVPIDRLRRTLEALQL